jgi:hypothetical protein
MRRNSSATSALPPAGAPSSPGVQKSSGKRAQQSSARGSFPKRAWLSASSSSVIPASLFWIDGLSAPKLGQRGFVVAELPMDYSPRIESCLRRGKRDDLVKVIESSLRVTKVHPY